MIVELIKEDDGDDGDDQDGDAGGKEEGGWA